jgi:L-cysteine S-thiosulfotransferase
MTLKKTRRPCRREAIMQQWRTMAACAAMLAALLGAAAAAEPNAATLFMENCQQCHQVKGVENTGNIGPALSDMKARFPDRTALFAIVFDETKRNPQTVMPPFGRNLILTKQQIDTVIDFLYSR